MNRDFLGRVKRFFEPGEKILFKDVELLTGLAKESVRKLNLLISAELDGDINTLKKYSQIIADLEKKGDNVTLRATEGIAAGSLVAGIRENFVQLLQKIDNLLDSSHFVAREIVRTVEYTPLKKSAKIEHLFLLLARLSELAIKSVEKLCLLLRTVQTNVKEAVKICFEIERLEETADDLKEEILDRIYEVSNEIKFQDFFHLVNLVHQLDNIIDGCEDASNLVTTIIKTLSS